MKWSDGCWAQAGIAAISSNNPDRRAFFNDDPHRWIVTLGCVKEQRGQPLRGGGNQSDMNHTVDLAAKVGEIGVECVQFRTDTPRVASRDAALGREAPSVSVDEMNSQRGLELATCADTLD